MEAYGLNLLAAGVFEQLTAWQYYPLLVLAVGIVTVLGMIIWLKLNAFLALTTAAIVVSLMAPGDTADKIGRVAKAFGEKAGGIAIVIAMAAIIGKCMMDSGAADRVVRFFLKLTGEKRAPVALMGSGFVLAVPVFFDTVFYLLVPLARSLYRRTGSNYLKYILAIAAGGAITHTLVPPTPGPLFMAANLGIDVGLMILVGGFVALPAALVGLGFAGFMDTKMPIPMRKLSDEPEPEILSDEELPSLFLSLLPVLLPVLLISANTVAKTLADAQNPARLTPAEVTDVSGFVAALNASAGADPETITSRVEERLTPEFREEMAQPGAAESAEFKTALVAQLNDRVLADDKFLDIAGDAFDPVFVRNPKLVRLREENPESGGLYGVLGSINSLSQQDRPDTIRLNRLLLEAAFPSYIERHEWETPARKIAGYTSLFGDPNLALLLSAAVSMWVLYRQRGITRTEMSHIVEVSLMSGGLIILITAAGGAFGEMLKAANIGDAVERIVGDQGHGMMMLFLGFGVAALLKVAQGSSTVAMITGSSMLAAMLVSGDPLPFNVVYLATAIGAGSLIGSWMNDSGFWIFAKMGGLTEVEALKSWTILLLVLGLTSFVMTLILATVLPLV